MSDMEWTSDSNIKRGSFVARHTSTFTKDCFDGLSSSLHPATRTTFDPQQDNPPELTKNIRTENTPVAHVVECVTEALTDLQSESFGRPCLFPHSSEGSNPDGTQKRNNDYCYKVHNIVFDPNGCTWDAMVTYSTLYVPNGQKSNGQTAPIKKNCQGKIPIHVECTKVFLPPGSKGAQNDRQKNKDDSNIHYSIDVTMIMKKELRYIEKPIRIALFETLNRLANDINKRIIKESLPPFPEGNRGVTFREIYQLNKKLKSGSFATVCAGTHRKSGKKFAVKCVYRKKLTPNDDLTILSEVQIMSSVRHPSICTIVDFFMEEECYFIVMPLMAGGDVFDRIANLKKYDENIARNLCSNMIEAIAHLHDNNIAHCDLKSRNLLLRSNDDATSVIIADFGFAAKVYSPNSLTKQCGTPYFVAPEILLRNGYDTRSDMWSIGVIIYSLLSGGLPFTGKTHLDLFKTIVKGSFDFKDAHWDNVTSDAKDLIAKLLVTDPTKRISAHDALRHSWIGAEANRLRRNSLINTSFRLKTFNARLAFKSAILATHSMIIWRNLTRDSKRKASEGTNSVASDSKDAANVLPNNPRNAHFDEDKLLGIEESDEDSNDLVVR